MAGGDAHGPRPRVPASGGDVEPWDRFWISSSAVEPVERVELGDLVARHAAAGIDLRTAADLVGLWERVIASTLDFSGIRLRNATMAPR